MFLVSGNYSIQLPKVSNAPLVALTSRNANIKEGGIMCPSSDFTRIQNMSFDLVSNTRILVHRPSVCLQGKASRLAYVLYQC